MEKRLSGIIKIIVELIKQNPNIGIIQSPATASSVVEGDWVRWEYIIRLQSKKPEKRNYVLIFFLGKSTTYKIRSSLSILIGLIL